MHRNDNEDSAGKDSSLALLNLTPPIYPARTRFYPLAPERLGTSSIAIKLDLSISRFFGEDEVACEQAWRHAASLIDQSVVRESQLRPLWLRERLAEAAIEIPPPSLQAVAKRNGYTSTTMFRRTAPELCDAIAENYLRSVRSGEQKRTVPNIARQIDIHALLEEELSKKSYRRTAQENSVKERDCIRSLIEGCLEQTKPRWKNIEHDTGWRRAKIDQYFPDLYARAKVLCKESRDHQSKSDLSAAEDHVRHAVEQLLASRTQPSIQNVHQRSPKGFIWVPLELRGFSERYGRNSFSRPQAVV